MASALAAFLKHGLFFDPWLAPGGLQAYGFEAQRLLYEEAARLSNEYSSRPDVAEQLGCMPLPPRLRLRASHEIMVSTAAALSEEQHGSVNIQRPEAVEAVARVNAFARTDGFGQLLRAYAALSFMEHCSALRYYGAITEDQFVTGALHRPWARDVLDDELLMGLAAGHYAIEVRDHVRCVVPTEAAQRRYERIATLMAECAYVDRQVNLATISLANGLSAAEKARVFPSLPEVSRALTRFAGVQHGTRVLVCCCGTGVEELAAGLRDAVGPTGHIVVVSAAAKQLKIARDKAAASSAELILGAPERMPYFQPGEFDAAIAWLPPAPANLGAIMAEVSRVVRPGGTVTLGLGVEPSALPDWFQDWFGPALAPGAQDRPGLGLPPDGRINELVAQSGIENVTRETQLVKLELREPASSVNVLMGGFGCFIARLEHMPAAARSALIDQLKERGRHSSVTGGEWPALMLPIEFVRGTTLPHPAHR